MSTIYELSTVKPRFVIEACLAMRDSEPREKLKSFRVLMQV